MLILYPVVEELRANNFVDAAIELIGSLRAELQYYAEALLSRCAGNPIKKNMN